jgi:putative toxin-antitoxin system antitoxin component (TIGR02293 family)
MPKKTIERSTALIIAVKDDAIRRTKRKARVVYRSGGVTRNEGKTESQMTPLEKMDMVRVGVTKRDLERLKERTELDYDMLAHALSVTRATLINKKGKEKFNSSVSERIVSLADLYSYGYEVFEDEERFNGWMFRPNKALGGKTPYELIDNQYGREEVRNIIGRIEHGVYS